MQHALAVGCDGVRGRLEAPVIGQEGDRMSKGYRLEFHIAGGHTVVTWLSIEDVDAMRLSGAYIPQRGVTVENDAEFRRLIVRTRLGYLTSGEVEGPLVVQEEGGPEWVIPMRSVIAATFTEPDESGQPKRIGFAPPGRLGVDVQSAPFTVIPGGPDPDQ